MGRGEGRHTAELRDKNAHGQDAAAFSANSYFSQSDINLFRKAGVLLIARTALQREVNLRLAAHPTIPQLAWTPDHDHRILFKPPNLLAAMWLRFAEAITGEFQLRRCVECRKYYQIGPGGRGPIQSLAQMRADKQSTDRNKLVAIDPLP